MRASQALPSRGRHRIPRRLGALAVVAFVLAGCNLSSGTPAPASGAAPSGGSTSSGAIASAEPSYDTTTPDRPSAAELIQADVDAGKIDQNTGLLYRIEAAVGASALPTQYASAPVREDAEAFDIAALTLDQMPAAIQDQLRPYLVRPTDARSAFHGSGAASGVGGLGLADVVAPLTGATSTRHPGDVVCGSDGWGSVSSATIPVTVWGICVGQGRDDADLTRALAAIESTYGDEISLMGDPIPDSGDADAGGSANIDIYLIDSCVVRAGRCRDISTAAAAVTVPTTPYLGNPGTRQSSGFILMDRWRNSAVDLKDVLTHEMFHVLEFAHNNEGLFEGGHWHWMTEASAEWSEEFFVPEGRLHWVYPDFAKWQATALGLPTTDDTNEYRSFIWPYFMDQENGPTAIADAWNAFIGVKGHQALNATLAGIVPFKDRFKDFAVRAWDAALPGGGSPDVINPRFQVVDSGFPKISPQPPAKFYFKVAPAMKKTDPAVKVPETLPALSVRYAELSLPDDVQQLVADFSGLQPDGPLDVTALVHTKSDGQWKKEELPKGKTTWCRAKEDVDRVIFVLDNNSYSANSPISGTWQYQALSDACSPGHWTADLKVLSPVMAKSLGQAGHFEGDGDVDCSFLSGEWNGTFGTGGQYYVDNVAQVEIHTGPNAWVSVNTAFLNDEPAWSVQKGFENGAVTVTVQDKGKNDVTLIAHAVNDFEQIDASLTCSTVYRETPASS